MSTASKQPAICHGTRVVFSSDPSRNDRSFGFVTEGSGESATIFVIGERQFDIRYDCLHIDDPRCVTNPDRFTTTSGYGSNGTGVFDLTDDEKRIRDVYDKLAGIEDFLLKVDARLTALEKAARTRA